MQRAADSTPDHRIGQVVGHYRLMQMVGEGGMGTVYEAVREDIGSRAAIKILHRELALNPEMATRFFNEARATNIVHHPAIVRVFDYGTTPDGTVYLAMEFLQGESLRSRLHREEKLTESMAIAVGRQIASGLATAHASQVIHRDLKPENIFLVPDSEAPSGERVKILDFGIAKLADANKGSFHTGTNMLLGTPIYMSPEQCRGAKNVGDRSDVYALGVMLFEMLSGRPPFLTEMPGEYIALHIFQPPPRLRDFASMVDDRLDQLVLSMLTKDPKHRPPMQDVAQRLKVLGNLQSDQYGRGAFERTSGPMSPLISQHPPKAEDPTELLPQAQDPSWQQMSFLPGRGAASASAIKPIPVAITRKSGDSLQKSPHANRFLTPQRRAQLVAVLFVLIAICLGVLITLLLVGN